MKAKKHGNTLFKSNHPNTHPPTHPPVSHSSAGAGDAAQLVHRGAPSNSLAQITIQKFKSIHRVKNYTKMHEISLTKPKRFFRQT